MRPVIISLFNHPMLHNIANQNNYEIGNVESRNFPDGETYLRYKSDLSNRDLIILDSLDNPNHKILPVIYAARTAKELGAQKVTLFTPYLAYMRQDIQFNPGECVTSKYFAELLSNYIDSLITIDPHLHRYNNLNQIYTIPTKVLHAANSIANWINNNIANPILIGPDSESEQWVKEVANLINEPYIVLEKIRHGDYDVKISTPKVSKYLDYTPVLIDDIISTASTMLITIQHLTELKMQPAVCIAVHPIFAANAYDNLHKANINQVVSCNTIAHQSNTIDLSELFKSL